MICWTVRHVHTHTNKIENQISQIERKFDIELLWNEELLLFWYVLLTFTGKCTRCAENIWTRSFFGFSAFLFLNSFVSFHLIILLRIISLLLVFDATVKDSKWSLLSIWDRHCCYAICVSSGLKKQVQKYLIKAKTIVCALCVSMKSSPRRFCWFFSCTMYKHCATNQFNDKREENCEKEKGI